MKSIFKALLFAGLFFTSFSQADMNNGGIDWSKEQTPIDGFIYTCNGSYSGAPTYTTDFMPLTECLAAAASYVSSKLPELPKSTTTDLGGGSTQTTNVSVTALPKPTPITEAGYSVGFKITQTTTTKMCAGDANGNPTCTTSTSKPYTFNIGGSVGIGQKKPGQVCPPDWPHMAANDNGVQKCYPYLPLLPCDTFAGNSSNKMVDKFSATKGLYSSGSPPHCLRTCHTNKDGYEQCGYCKVVAKSWSSTSSGNKEVWWANVGTFTGTACGANDDAEKPKEPPPVCWKSKNGLKMCQADPDKQCQTINGIRQCKQGCGEVNGDFFCKTDERPPRDFDKKGDKELPEISDDITNPEKSINDMQKGDFKDVLKGVETRVSASIQGIANVENSVDNVNNTLLDIKDSIDVQTETEEAQTDQLGEINSKLGQIADGMGQPGGGDGDGDGDGGPDGNGECDPNKSPDCVAASGVTSWWKSSYENGLSGLFAEKMNNFKNSQAYATLNTPLQLSGGGATPRWNFCMNFGFADYGCSEINIPDFIWHFIKACMLFGAAILCRRMIIGA